jgi:hypothetical protein
VIGGTVPCILNFCTGWRRGVKSASRPGSFAPSENSPWYQFYRRLCGPHNLCERCWENHLAFARNRTTILRSTIYIQDTIFKEQCRLSLTAETFLEVDVFATGHFSFQRITETSSCGHWSHTKTHEPFKTSDSMVSPSFCQNSLTKLKLYQKIYMAECKSGKREALSLTKEQERWLFLLWRVNQNKQWILECVSRNSFPWVYCDEKRDAYRTTVACRAVTMQWSRYKQI